MNCSSCIEGICTNGCASNFRMPNLVAPAADKAIAAAKHDPKTLSEARALDMARIRAHMEHMHPGRIPYAIKTITQIASGQRRYNDQSQVKSEDRSAA
ncbi:hypothetical protein [Marinobacterium lutimaris]|uniref:Uncharacterized protein n=1 Tax=Marinobacterium lutimaris TaxID=568106 RepID=A0A1H5XX74_9GAMM|nr:hypothetical protein [Marinobacterium lutimaris]SEG16057.1 hypothetical protein SAMN05444390_1011529 [Marinobacterium lutimaris]